MRTLYVLLFLCIVFSSCRNKAAGTINADTTNVRDTIYIDIDGKEYKFLGQIPDSLRTDEQARLIMELNNITINHIAVNDENRLVFQLSKEEFLKRGIPERYYRLIQQNIIDNNDFFDRNGIENVHEIMKKRKEDYNRSLRINK